jgi:hypothetical protein
MSGVERLRLTYTALSGLKAPERGALIRFAGDFTDGLFRVKDKPQVDDDGTFTFEVERVDD